MNGSWNNSFTGIARANVLLEALDRVDVPNEAAIVAELRTLRGFYYYLLMDMFGGVPIVTTTEIKARARDTRDSVFKFIESELLDARTDLPDSWPAASNGRLTKGAADAILASMYLNAGVWMKETGVSATAYNTSGGAGQRRRRRLPSRDRCRRSHHQFRPVQPGGQLALELHLR
jgi:hypothetical protein